MEELNSSMSQMCHHAFFSWRCEKGDRDAQLCTADQYIRFVLKTNLSNKLSVLSFILANILTTRNQALWAWFQNSRCLFTKNILIIINNKVTGLRAFEEHLPYQKYQGPPIVVRYVCLELQQQLKNSLFEGEFKRQINQNFRTVKHIEF